jgi:hypothetical protein
MEEPLYIDDQNEDSKRWAIVADEGDSVWLYLTEPDGTRPIADCWLLNKIPAPDDTAKYKTTKSAPAATKAYVSASALRAVPNQENLKIQWSEDGHSVTVIEAGEILGFIAAGSKYGWSKELIAEGPFGKPLNIALYLELFGGALH